ncbi:MAG: hypothetical protein EOP83_32070 [Verrucomicrobiaceae bacterium]|nr:MAG: hypothetical protein EOP83_32070 [Verrucomicrobiaceae bacterium]
MSFARTPFWRWACSGMMNVLRGEESNREREKQLRDSPMKLPVKFYQYDTTRNWNGSIGGLAVGPVFEARAGSSYPIEILLSEIPGGLFCASLLIEEIGAEYQKDGNGSPILPLFRLDNLNPEPGDADNSPPFDPGAPAWKVGEPGRLGI